MSPALSSFTAGLIGLFVLFLLNLIVLRLPGSMAPVNRQTVLAVAIHVLTTMLAACLVADITYWHGAALYWLGFNCQLYAFSAVYKSVSLRTLSQLAHAPEQSITLNSLVEEHIRPCFAQRTSLLVKAGLAQEQAGMFAITTKGKQLAARLMSIQRLFAIRACGLYTTSR